MVYNANRRERQPSALNGFANHASAWPTQLRID